MFEILVFFEGNKEDVDDIVQVWKREIHTKNNSNIIANFTTDNKHLKFDYDLSNCF